jgi:hypothetical protein
MAIAYQSRNERDGSPLVIAEHANMLKTTQTYPTKSAAPSVIAPSEYSHQSHAPLISGGQDFSPKRRNLISRLLKVGHSPPSTTTPIHQLILPAPRARTICPRPPWPSPLPRHFQSHPCRCQNHRIPPTFTARDRALFGRGDTEDAD